MFISLTFWIIYMCQQIFFSQDYDEIPKSMTSSQVLFLFDLLVLL